jgi:glycosyltransferase involved in cell wall biosynthesis
MRSRPATGLREWIKGEHLRILTVHNRYQQPGGEEVVVAQESAMLRAQGHEVDLLEADNDHIDSAVSGLEAVKVALECVYSRSSARTIRERVRDFRPDVVHIHNFFPTLSPSIHHAVAATGIPVIQTLHNYRLLCPASTLLRDGALCEDCINKLVPWSSIRHKCYRGSRGASAAVAAMLATHRSMGTWRRTVTRFIALTKFAAGKFAQGGIPNERIAVKPNFVAEDPGTGEGGGNYLLFVGRLTAEKGIGTLLEAARSLPHDIKLRILGDGPMRERVMQAAQVNPAIEWLPWQERKQVFRLMTGASLLVVPSVWYEGFCLVAIEAYATGLPVIASRIGVFPEIVRDGITGRLFEAGNASDLVQKISETLRSPEKLLELRRSARREYEQKYTPDTNYPALMNIYREAIAMTHKLV